MPSLKDRTGETKCMNCGMQATIVQYTNSHDITVQFEDGTILEHKYYGDFQKGKIQNPKYKIDNKTYIGKTNMMKCGLSATLIEYRSNTDVDVQFDDGTIVYKRLYQDFVRGEIIHPNLKFDVNKIIGQKQMMHCGEIATIIAYRKSDDIDVEFEDGTIVQHRSLSAFKGSRIQHPKNKIIVSAEDKTLGRYVIGESRVMSCGLKANIIAYRSSKDIDIQFEDGEIVYNKNYGNFIKGKIEHPYIRPSASYPERVISGFLRAAKINFKAEWSDKTLRGENQKKPLYFDFAVFDSKENVVLLIEYQGKQHFEETKLFGDTRTFERLKKHDFMKKEYAEQNNIPLIEIPYVISSFEDIVTFLNENLRKYHILNNMVSFPIELDTINVVDLNTLRVGESKMMNCGVAATVIAYRSSSDIDVQFEDGFVLSNVSYRRFMLCELVPDKLKRKNQIACNRTGQTQIMKCGMRATIIRYGNANDIDIQFEDGTIRPKQNYINFTNGKIGNPNKKQSKSKEKYRVGLTKKMNCGMVATIITYRNSSDIDVQFENGEIVTNRSFSSFQRGAISTPSIMSTKHRLGETKKMNCGMNATIIEYRTSDDIDVCFEDGTVLRGRTYDAFKRCEISNPTIYAERLNETRLMNCGMMAKIIAYRKYNDIDIQFDDGTIIQHRSYGDFVKAAISNPNLYKKVKCWINRGVDLTNKEKHNLYNEAIAFYELAECGRQNIPEKNHVESHIPYIVNMAFCTELLLKFLLVEEGKSIEDVIKLSHNLKSLYDALLPQTKEHIYLSFKRPMIFDIDTELERTKKAFVDWRYLVLDKLNGHNKHIQVAPYFLKEFNEILISICKSYYN